MPTRPDLGINVKNAITTQLGTLRGWDDNDMSCQSKSDNVLLYVTG